MVDDKAATKKMMDEYWNPMWEVSYTGEDCDVQAVMDGLKIDRDSHQTYLSPLEKIQMQQAQGGGVHSNGDYVDNE